MNKRDDLSADHLTWLVENRSANQRASLALFNLIKDQGDDIRGDAELHDVAQALVAACFSLWRAVFLSDKVGGHENMLEDAETFLGKVILDNAISYPQDRSTREWSFSYYLNNARYRLQAISATSPNIVPPDEISEETIRALPKRGGHKDHWRFWQSVLCRAIERLSGHVT